MSTTIDQQVVDLFTPAPAVTPWSARWLESLLEDCKGWVKAKEIQSMVMNRLSDRNIREIASASPNIISGQQGYKHIAHATAEEVNHAANWLESQAVKMGDRARAIRKRAHQIFG